MIARSEKYCYHRDTCKNHLTASCPVDCWQYETYHNVLCNRALALGDDALTEKEQAYIYGVLTLEQLQDPNLKIVGNTIIEICPTCGGSGLCDEIDGEQSSCFNCLGSGRLKY